MGEKIMIEGSLPNDFQQKKAIKASIIIKHITITIILAGIPVISDKESASCPKKPRRTKPPA